MIKVIKEDGNLYYLSEYAYSRLEYCKKEGVLIAYPIIPKLPEVKLLGVKRIIDNVKVEEVHQGPNMTDFRNHSIEEVLDVIRKNAKRNGYTRIKKIFEKLKISKVGDIDSKNIFIYHEGVGKKMVKAISEALKELYGINW